MYAPVTPAHTSDPNPRPRLQRRELILGRGRVRPRHHQLLPPHHGPRAPRLDVETRPANLDPVPHARLHRRFPRRRRGQGLQFLVRQFALQGGYAAARVQDQHHGYPRGGREALRVGLSGGGDRGVDDGGAERRFGLEGVPESRRDGVDWGSLLDARSGRWTVAEMGFVGTYPTAPTWLAGREPRVNDTDLGESRRRRPGWFDGGNVRWRFRVEFTSISSPWREIRPIPSRGILVPRRGIQGRTRCVTERRKGGGKKGGL